MNTLKLELNLNDIVDDMFCDAEVCEFGGVSPTQSFSEAVRSDVISSVSRSLVNELSEVSKRKASDMAVKVANDFIESELGGIVSRKLRSGELLIMNTHFKSFDDLVAHRISRFDIDRVIKDHIDKKTNDFAKEMKLRYDNIFAAKVVQGLAKQKMLDPNIAKMLLGED